MNIYVKHQGIFFIGLKRIIEKARKNGDFNIPHERLGYIISPNKGQLTINLSRITNIDGTDLFQITKGLVEGYLQILEIIKFLNKYVPGFEKSKINQISPIFGVRETRHFIGLKTLINDQVFNGSIPEDTIALSAYNIDIHKNDYTADLIPLDKPFGIPYGCLVSRDVMGLLLSGRCISVESMVYGSSRIMGTCMAIGEAAGIAASLCVKKKIIPSDIDPIDVVNILKRNGAVLSV